jgi:hypothetical protein
LESGRYEITKDKDGKKIPLERTNRICLLCRGNCVEDETHFLIVITYYFFVCFVVDRG